jgi:hypothetical protein
MFSINVKVVPGDIITVNCANNSDQYDYFVSTTSGSDFKRSFTPGLAWLVYGNSYVFNVTGGGSRTFVSQYWPLRQGSFFLTIQISAIATIANSSILNLTSGSYASVAPISANGGQGL